MSDWRAALEAVSGAVGSTAATPVEPPRTPLALQFEVRETVRRAAGRWQHPSKTTAVAGPESVGELVLTVRPATPGVSGRWVGGGLDWTNLPHQVHQLGLDPRQVRWFVEFAALARARVGAYLGRDPVRLALDDFPSTLLWPLLRQAGQLGVPLVGAGRADAAVRLGDAAGIRIEPAGSADGTVTLTPIALIDDREVTDASLGLIGDHGLYAVTWPGPVVRLAPSSEPLGREQLRVLERGPIVVPADERGDVELALRDAEIAREAARSGTGGSDEPGGQGTADVEDTLDYPDLDELPALELTAAPSDQNDWLELGFIVRVGDRQVPFAKLFSALARGDRRLRMVDKSYLRLDQPVFERLRILIEEAGGLNEWQTGVRVHRAQASLYADFEDLSDQTEGAVEWRAKARELLDAAEAGDASVESPIPSGLAAALRPYQQAGFAWLARLHDHGLGGVLADDMGLGKTVQTLALVLRVVEGGGGPFLVVAPSSVVGNWVAEAARFTPTLRVASVTHRDDELPNPADVDLVVTSYAIFRLEFERFDAREWAGLLLDEAQFVKNHRSRAHEFAKLLRAQFKLAITGTPFENNVLELWSLLDLVAPGLFPSVRRFTEQYVKPISHVTADDAVRRGVSAADASRVLARLRRRIRPVVLRRTKELVAPELPAKQEQLISVELAPKHRRLYEQVLQRERQKLLGLLAEDFDRQRFILFRSITLLRMLALDAALIDDAHDHIASAKLDALLEHLDDVVAEGHRALVFSQFTSFLKRAAARLDTAGIAYEYLDGSTADRPETIAAFKDGTAPVFLISLKAGGFGINLTEADYVFLLDPWWNPASEAQAIDRAHRLGQDKNVNVYRIVAANTIEEKVMALRDRKAALFDEVLDDDGSFSGALTADDMRGLLEP